MKTTFLEFYKQCMNANQTMPREGLCNNNIRKYTLRKFTPTDAEKAELRANNMPAGHWAQGESFYGPCEFNSFTPLRQTIVLFCAAINKEL